MRFDMFPPQIVRTAPPSGVVYLAIDTLAQRVPTRLRAGNRHSHRCAENSSVIVRRESVLQVQQLLDEGEKPLAGRAQVTRCDEVRGAQSGIEHPGDRSDE